MKSKLTAAGQLPIPQKPRHYSALNNMSLRWAAVEDGLNHADVHGEECLRSELHRTAGLIHLARGETRKSQTEFQDGLDVARSQGANWFAMRNAVSLHEVVQSDATRGVVQGLVNSWPEGRDSHDIDFAKNALS